MIAPTVERITADAQAALAEDIGTGDLSRRLIENRLVTARLVCREKAVLCGIAWFEACFRLLGKMTFDWRYADGDECDGNNEAICMLRGTAHALLTAERSALNFLQTLSATATAARRWQRLAVNDITVVDTRKTLPLLRRAQKYATRIGGVRNHRFGLDDEILIKENHLRIAGGDISAVLAKAFAVTDKTKVQIEVRTPAELRTAVAAGATRVLLDNFTVADLRAAVTAVDTKMVELEASGGFGEDDLAAIAATGIARISVGALTKNIKAVDFSLQCEHTP